jgi:DNA-binding CsgD family transcriptional regulator
VRNRQVSIIHPDQVSADVPHKVALLSSEHSKAWISGACAASGIELELRAGVNGPWRLPLPLWSTTSRHSPECSLFKVVSVTTVTDHPKLSRDDLELLRLLAGRLSLESISRIVEISERTVPGLWTWSHNLCEAQDRVLTSYRRVRLVPG